MSQAGQAEALHAAIEAWVGRAAGAPAHVAGLRALAGGASQEAWALDLTLEAGAEAGTHALVLRRDLGGALNPEALSRLQEFRVIQAAYAGGVLAPRPYWATEDLLGRPAFLMARLEGETIGRRLVQGPRWAAARARLPEQMAQQLALIHRLDPAAHGLDFLPAPAPGQAPAERLLDRFERQLDTIAEAHPALELGLRWLRRHAPPRGEIAVVHGDFRLGNVVVGPEELRGVLDWEFAHLSDPLEDIGWCLVRAWRFGQDALRFAGVAPVEPFWRAYERAGGRRLDPDAVFYWEVMGNLAWAIGALGQRERHLSGAEPSVELAALGRICAEMELELLDLIMRRG